MKLCSIAIVLELSHYDSHTKVIFMCLDVILEPLNSQFCTSPLVSGQKLDKFLSNSRKNKINLQLHEQDAASFLQLFLIVFWLFFDPFCSALENLFGKDNFLQCAETRVSGQK